MALPPRFSWTIQEAACRWGCMPADIVGWAMARKIEITTVIRAVTAAGNEVSGVVAIPPEDIMTMFRRDGSGPRAVVIHRLRPTNSSDKWQRITEPQEGLQIEPIDVLITCDELEKFEDEHGLTKRSGAGGTAKYDWEAFYVALIRRIHNHGLPEEQRELVQEMQGWFERRSGDSPDESTIRRKIKTVWTELREG